MCRVAYIIVAIIEAGELVFMNELTVEWMAGHRGNRIFDATKCCKAAYYTYIVSSSQQVIHVGRLAEGRAAGW